MSGSCAKNEHPRRGATRLSAGTLRSCQRLNALLLAGLFGSLVACSKESKPIAEDPKVPASSTSESAGAAVTKPEATNAPTSAQPSKPAAASAAAGAALKSKVSEDSYELKLEPSGTYKVGAAGTVQLVLDAKAPFKVNQEYPYSFSLNEAPGVKFASMKVAEDAVKLEQKRATMNIPFTPSEAGERTISGTFKFSVCTDEQCLIKKQELALAVNVQ